jgi:hypothetical protein
VSTTASPPCATCLPSARPKARSKKSTHTAQVLHSASQAQSTPQLCGSDTSQLFTSPERLATRQDDQCGFQSFTQPSATDVTARRPSNSTKGSILKSCVFVPRCFALVVLFVTRVYDVVSPVCNMSPVHTPQPLQLFPGSLRLERWTEWLEGNDTANAKTSLDHR